MHAYPKEPGEPNTSYMYMYSFCLIYNTVIEGCIFHVVAFDWLL